MQVCICTIIKNEQEYLEDWLRYTLDLGVDKIFIVEDIGSEPHTFIIEKYSDRVEVLNISFNNIEHPDSIKSRQPYFQTKMFEYVKSLNIFDWCFIMDIDEYITITEDISLKELLSEYNNYTELVLYWKNFGSNGHIEKPDYSKVKSYREYYTKECNLSYLDARYSFIMKKAINLNKINDGYHVSQHHHTTTEYIKTNFKQGIHTPCYDRAYLSHYVTKSWEEYIWKLLIRGMCCVDHRKIDDFFEMNSEFRNSRKELEEMIPEIQKKYTN